MAQLHELLREDQEPFLLKSYIAVKRGQLKRPSPPKTQLQVKKRSRPISDVSNFPKNLCRKACFFSLQDSPDLKSPLFEFPSPAKTTAKSPCKSPNAVFLHIPTRTAALLVEAAMRIQKQSNGSKPKSQNQTKDNGFGLIGSFLKRLKTRAHKRDQMTDQIEKEGTIMKISSEASKDLSFGCSGSICLEQQSGREMCVDSSSNVNSGPGTSEVWSTLEMETSTTTSQSDFYSEVVLGTSTDYVCCEDKLFCESPFRFVLETTSPSPSGGRTPEFTSPATSPARHKLEEKEGSKSFQNEEEEEDKEQCSPVSVLDPPFEDDDEEHDEHGFDMECSYAIMQRTKKQLMQKLRRFEKLTELDPIELEKRMSEEYDDDDDEDYKSIGEEEAESEECDDEESRTSENSSREVNLNGRVREILSKSRFPSSKRTGQDVKRLVSDLVVEERGEENDGFSNGEELTRRVCKRFSSWNEVKSNTIDMMVDQDFRVDLSSWKQNQDQAEETAEEVELAIFYLLVEELAMELAC